MELGLRLWQGRFEDYENTWLRWVDAAGEPILTGAERAEQADELAELQRMQAEQHRQRAEQEAQRAEQEARRAERLAEQLRSLGVEPGA